MSEKLTHPPLSNPSALIDWLVEWGGKHPGTLLYPPNDHLAWLFAANRERLGKVFRCFSPDEVVGVHAQEEAPRRVRRGRD